MFIMAKKVETTWKPISKWLNKLCSFDSKDQCDLLKSELNLYALAGNDGLSILCVV